MLLQNKLIYTIYRIRLPFSPLVLKHDFKQKIKELHMKSTLDSEAEKCYSGVR